MPSNGYLMKILPIFSNGIFKLENLPRLHLVSLYQMYYLLIYLINNDQTNEEVSYIITLFYNVYFS